MSGVKPGADTDADAGVEAGVSMDESLTGWVPDKKLDQGSNNCSVPCDYVPCRSWPLFRARDLMQGLIASFKTQKHP